MSDDFLIRMKLERNNLNDKIGRLSIFLKQMNPGSMVHPEEYDLMCEQLRIMRKYLAILVQRIQLHEKEGEK